MRRHTGKNRIKDDSSIRQITKRFEQERQMLGIDPLPIDAETATELWKLWQTFEAIGEVHPEGVIKLFASVEGDKLVLKEPASLPVDGNEIRIGKTKIVITLEPSKGENHPEHHHD
ncbi:hypothetical protein FJZ31_20245 [Candidatus Poribacteria bacterium]|nr:hypothetical protein [Candidatus Poribacteria bacterium]